MSYDLFGRAGFNPDDVRRFELVRRGGALLFERESLVLFQQSLALAAQALVLITVLHGGKVLLRSKDKPPASTRPQNNNSARRESADVACGESLR